MNISIKSIHFSADRKLEELIQTKIDFENDQELAASEVQTVFFFYENKDKYCWKNKCLLLKY